MSRSIWKGPFTDLIKNIIPKKGQQVKQKPMSLQKQESLPGTTSWQAGPVGIATFPYQVKPSGKAADSAFPLVSEEASAASSEARGNAVMGREGAEKRIFKKVRIWSRRSQIMPLDVGKSVHVHNGRNFIGVKCVESMCSHKWGEFAVTRKKPVHKFNKKKQLHKTPYKKVHS